MHEVGNSMMVTLADGDERAEPRSRPTRTSTSRIWFLSARGRDRRQHDDPNLEVCLACADAHGQPFVPVLLVSDRDVIERRARGLLGGAVQRETTMNVNYNPDADNSAPPGAAKPATEARQGVISGRVLLVLVVSTVLVVIGMALAYAVWA
jgi:hypothetical protein